MDRTKLASAGLRVLATLLACVGLGSAALAGPPVADEPVLERVAREELELTTAANAVARGQAALERERESLRFAAGLIGRQTDESLRQLDAYREVRVDREQLARARARELYKLARGGGMLELMFEDGAEGHLTTRERAARGRTAQTLVARDLELLSTHAEAEQRARDELLSATRELSVLAALDGIAQMEADALALIDVQLDPALADSHDRRRVLERRRRGRRTSAELELLNQIAAARETLRGHKGLDLLEEGALVRPVRGRVVGEFGTYEDPQLGVEMHRNGVELRSYPNDRVRALAPGEVVLVGALPGFERVVVIDHGGGYLSLTAHLLSVEVVEGEIVEAGVAIGRVGAKAVPDGLGTSVYIEIRHGQRPIDPSGYL